MQISLKYFPFSYRFKSKHAFMENLQSPVNPNKLKHTFVKKEI